jgi:hypothetical protein
MLGANQRELQRMGSEKVFAAIESWNAMLMQTFWEQQRLAWTFALSLWFPWLPRPGARQISSAALNVLGKGVAPYRRRASANAARLRRTRRR